MRNRRGVVLLIVLATVLVGVIITAAMLGIVSNQSRLTHHHVSRIKAYYAATGIMNYVIEQLRKGNYVPNPSDTGDIYACHRECIDAGVTETYTIPVDADIPYKIQVKIYSKNRGTKAFFADVVTQLEAKVQYTYTP
jgi:Tfp pilus assembly protein PilX